MTVAYPGDTNSSQKLFRKWATPLIGIGVFFAAYLSWRPGEILFTMSDGFFVAGAFLALLSRSLPVRPFGPYSGYWMAAVILMLGGLLLGSLINGDPMRWTTGAMQYGASLILVPLILMAQPASRTHFYMRMHLYGFGAMMLFSVIVYYAYDGSPDDLRRFGNNFVSGAGRLGSFLGDANRTGALIAMTLPFVIYLRVRGVIGTLQAGTAGAVLILALMLTASVGGLTSTVVAIAVFSAVAGVRFSPRLMIGWVAMALVVGMFIVQFGLPQAFQDRVTPALESGNVEQAGTFTSRWALIQEAWELVNSTMIVGLGIDQYRIVSTHLAPVHNMFLLLWAEGGLASLIGWLGLFVVMGVGGISAIGRDRLAAALALSVLVSFAVVSTAAPHLYARMLYVPLFLGLAPAFATLSRPLRPQTPARNRVSRNPQSVVL